MGHFFFFGQVFLQSTRGLHVPAGGGGGRQMLSGTRGYSTVLLVTTKNRKKKKKERKQRRWNSFSKTHTPYSTLQKTLLFSVGFFMVLLATPALKSIQVKVMAVMFHITEVRTLPQRGMCCGASPISQSQGTGRPSHSHDSESFIYISALELGLCLADGHDIS